MLSLSICESTSIGAVIYFLEDFDDDDGEYDHQGVPKKHFFGISFPRLNHWCGLVPRAPEKISALQTHKRQTANDLKFWPHIGVKRLPENYFFPSKIALPKVRSCKHDSLLSLHFFFNSDCPSNLLFTANHTFNELFWTEDDNQNTEIRIHDSGEQIRNEILRNTTAEMESQKWTNWGWGSGQTGGGARSALATT